MGGHIEDGSDTVRPSSEGDRSGGLFIKNDSTATSVQSTKQLAPLTKCLHGQHIVSQVKGATGEDAVYSIRLFCFRLRILCRLKMRGLELYQVKILCLWWQEQRQALWVRTSQLLIRVSDRREPKAKDVARAVLLIVATVIQGKIFVKRPRAREGACGKSAVALCNDSRNQERAGLVKPKRKEKNLEIQGARVQKANDA